MSEPDPPPIPVTSMRRSIWDRVSVVWLVPLAALLIALGLAWQNFRSAGPVIQIAFDSAAGVTPRETELRFRDVTVGLVERVQFTEGLGQVLVSVRLDPEVAPYVDEDAQFWVVRPVISTQGISGIETVLSGVFIEGVWDDVPGEPLDLYQGQATQPLLSAGQQGLRLTLRATEGLLTAAVPLLYKGVEVGRVGDPRVAEDGLSVEADAVVYAPYDRLVTPFTRFWDASGFTLSLGAAGAEVNFASLSSLIVGGLTFDTFVASGEPVEDGAVFFVHWDEAAARASIFAEPQGPTLTLMAEFEGSGTGLAAGAPVELEGLRVGEVTGVSGVVDAERFGDARVRVQAVLSIRPSRFGLSGTEDEALAWFAERVAEGLRARLATGNILTGGLKIQLVDVADAPPARLDPEAQPYPLLPTTDPDVTDVAASAQSTLARIDALPIEQLLASAVGFLDNASRLVGSAETQAIPGDLRGVLADMRTITAAPATQALPADLSRALAEVEGATADLRALLLRLEEVDAAGRLAAALDSAATAADRIAVASDGLPDLVSRLSGVAARVEALDPETLLAELTGVARDARALLAQPGVQDFPQRLAGIGAEAEAAVAEARAGLADLRASLDQVDAAALAARLDATLASAEAAAASVRSAAEGLPGIVARLDSLAARADALPLEEVAEEVRALAAAANALVGSPAAQALPGDLSAALSEAEALLREVREGGLVANANATLASAQAAAASIETAAQGLPGIVARLDSLAARADALPLEEVAEEVRALAAAANALVGSPAAQALPGDLSAALSEAEALLREVREGGLVANANATLASAQAAAASIETAAQGLPGIVARLDSLAARADALPLEEVAEEVRALAAAANALVGSPAAQALPGDLSAALSEAEALLREAREGGVIANANAALASLRAAADSLPALIGRTGGLLDQAGLAIEGLTGTAGIVREAQIAIGEVGAAARAVADLARAIERNPNSLIFGR
ncbi:intermembrane transport protein PqiB [Rubellimicrobium sp. CFH 75288]|uniref:PqiB family protein n=1 Tax=Rubellimicrobium sp. CFH 75288 TaxID=2697034 RepID=UPI001411CADF|nr:MlaD family protein [Rubellimicrobium sp. CFH 75288]NAZ35440.1 MCE family protein [Rubellimicrobium sp. CFH 75288]